MLPAMASKKKLPDPPETPAPETRPEVAVFEATDTSRMAVPADFAPTRSAPPPARRGMGYSPDVPDPRDWSTRAMLGAVRGLPTEASLERFVSRVQDQGSTNSCVGQALATAIEIRLRKMGYLTAPRPSALGIYGYGRALSRRSPTDKLADLGCFPRPAMTGLRDWGVPTEVAWPFDASKVNDELPWDVHQQSSAFRVQAWYRIDALGRERVDAICSALSQGYPVVFGVSIDEAFLSHTGKALVGAPTGAIIGGHMMVLVGYSTTNAKRTLRGINSWGESWGDHGAFNASESLVRHAGAGDFYVIQVGG